MEVIVRCECGLEYSLLAGEEKRIEICQQCGGVLRVPPASELAPAPPAVRPAPKAKKPSRPKPPRGKKAAGRAAGPRARKTPPPARTSAPATPPAKKGVRPPAKRPLKAPAPPDDGIETFPTEPSPGGAGAGTRACPNCGDDIPADVHICDECGFNIETGDFIRIKQKAKKRRPRGTGAPAAPAVPHWVVCLAVGIAVTIVFFVLSPRLVGPLVVKDRLRNAFFMGLGAAALTGAALRMVFVAPFIGTAGGMLLLILLYGAATKAPVRRMNLDRIFIPVLCGASAVIAGMWSAQLGREEGRRSALAAGAIWAISVSVYLCWRAKGTPLDLQHVLAKMPPYLLTGLAFALIGSWLYEDVLKGS